MAFCVAVMAKSFLKVAQIFGGQKFSPASFWRNLLKTKFFRRQVSFIVAYIWSIILSWASHYQLADVICIVSSIPSLARFSFFTNFRPKKNCAKNEFSTDFLQNLKFKRVSMLQGLAYHMNRKTVLLRFKKRVLIQVYTLSEFFCLVFCRKWSNSRIHYYLMTIPKNFILFFRQKPKPQFITPTSWLGELVRSFLWYTLS